MDETTQNDSKKYLIYGGLLIVGIVVGWFMNVTFSQGGDLSNTKRSAPPVSLSDVSISGAAPTGTSEVKKLFIGKWQGTWNKTSQLPQYYLDAVVAVRSIKEDGTADVLYSWGSNSFLKLDGGKHEGEGKFAEDGTLMIQLPATNGAREGILISFRMADTGGESMVGTYQVASQPSSSAVFQKVR